MNDSDKARELLEEEVVRDRLIAVSEALVRIDVAIEQLTAAHNVLSWAMPHNSDETRIVDQANERARMAREQLRSVQSNIRVHKVRQRA